MKNEIYARTEILLGEDNVRKLNSMHVVLCGVGGVGSFVFESLVRIGIGKITVIDKDTIDITNINRQIIALETNVGEDKVQAAKERAYKINKECNVIAIKENITLDNIDELIPKCDYVVDCVDNFEAKMALITNCNKNGQRIISCMGMANKLNPLDVRVSDINKTSVCHLAKKIRKELKNTNIKKLKVIYSLETPLKTNKEKYGNTLGSVSFVPSTAGLLMASEVVKDLLQI